APGQRLRAENFGHWTKCSDGALGTSVVRAGAAADGWPWVMLTLSRTRLEFAVTVVTTRSEVLSFSSRLPLTLRIIAMNHLRQGSESSQQTPSLELSRNRNKWW